MKLKKMTAVIVMCTCILSLFPHISVFADSNSNVREDLSTCIKECWNLYKETPSGNDILDTNIKLYSKFIPSIEKYNLKNEISSAANVYSSTDSTNEDYSKALAQLNSVKEDFISKIQTKLPSPVVLFSYFKNVKYNLSETTICDNSDNAQPGYELISPADYNEFQKICDDTDSLLKRYDDGKASQEEITEACEHLQSVYDNFYDNITSVDFTYEFVEDLVSKIDFLLDNSGSSAENASANGKLFYIENSSIADNARNSCNLIKNAHDDDDDNPLSSNRSLYNSANNAYINLLSNTKYTCPAQSASISADQFLSEIKNAKNLTDNFFILPSEQNGNDVNYNFTWVNKNIFENTKNSVSAAENIYNANIGNSSYNFVNDYINLAQSLNNFVSAATFKTATVDALKNTIEIAENAKSSVYQYNADTEKRPEYGTPYVYEYAAKYLEDSILNAYTIIHDIEHNEYGYDLNLLYDKLTNISYKLDNSLAFFNSQIRLNEAPKSDETDTPSAGADDENIDNNATPDTSVNDSPSTGENTTIYLFILSAFASMLTLIIASTAQARSSRKIYKHK